MRRARRVSARDVSGCRGGRPAAGSTTRTAYVPRVTFLRLRGGGPWRRSRACGGSADRCCVGAGRAGCTTLMTGTGRSGMPVTTGRNPREGSREAALRRDETRRDQLALLLELREVEHWRRLVAARLDLAVAAVAAVDEPVVRHLPAAPA